MMNPSSQTDGLAQERPPTAADTVWGTVGDWLLTFAAAPSLWPARLPAAPWQPARQGASWQLWRASPGEGWRGMPLLAFDTPRWSVWLAGELYGTAEPAAAVLAVLDGRASAATLNGHFLLSAHDAQADEWHVWTNRHATLHAYLATDGARTALGTFMPAVAAAAGRTELDWEGLTSFFGFGFFAANRTYLQGVRILRPATHYRFDARGRALGEERYWQWSYEPDAVRTYDETLDEFAGLFHTVMRDLTAWGRVAIPISGGLDSRSTVATIGGPAGQNAAADARLWAYSYGFSRDSVETHIASQIAARRGLRFDAYTIQPYLFDRMEQVIGSIEGFQDVTQARQAFIGRELRANADAVIAAHWGDVFLDDMGLAGVTDVSLTHEALLDHAQHKLSKPGGWLLDILCRPRLGATSPEAVLHGFVAEGMAGLSGIADPDFRVKAFKTEQWSARWTTASLRMFQAAAWPRLPFYDTRLVDFFTTVPTEFVAGRRLQIDYLKRYAPDLAAVPWQVSGSSLFKAGGRDPLGLVRRGFNKGRRVLTGRRVIERNWEVQFLNDSGRRGLQHWLLRPGLRLHAFVDPLHIESMLASFHAAPQAGKRGYTVSMLLTFSAWLERFGGWEAAER